MARILIVEDEEKIARFVELELKHEGYETEYEYSGFLPRLVITKVTWKARLRKLKRWKPFTIADGRN